MIVTSERYEQCETVARWDEPSLRDLRFAVRFLDSISVNRRQTYGSGLGPLPYPKHLLVYAVAAAPTLWKVELETS